MQEAKVSSPFEVNNVRRFIAFRVFFNARFYYPVFAVLFLDMGLTLSHFALLNAAWAASIVVLEVPSGAFADIIGRRKLLVTAGVLMVVEMAILCFIPLGNVDLLFAVFLVNRILSGAAEAAASGADEAIAFDALAEAGDPDDWDRVLERMMRLQSIARIVAVLMGAMVYDPVLLQKGADLVGLNVTFTQEMTLRFPLYLTFLMALGTLYTVLKLDEPPVQDSDTQKNKSKWETIVRAFRMTFKAGRWILKTPFALMIIVSGLLFDHVIRMLLTMNSQYYRLIDLPEASFGLIGSARSLLGLFIPAIALVMARRLSPRINLCALALVTFMGLYTMTFFWPIWGLIPAFILSAVMYFVAFFTSRYLNRITESSQRATVLSFKGLSFNLAYGLIGIMYSLLLAFLREGSKNASITGVTDLTDRVFVESVGWFPWYFLAAFATVLIIGTVVMRGRKEHKIPQAGNNVKNSDAGS